MESETGGGEGAVNLALLVLSCWIGGLKTPTLFSVVF